MAAPPASLNRRIAQSAGIVMATVLASRVLGFLRDWTVAREIGSSAATDAYYAAFTLPDFLNYLVAGGSLSLTFIPVFSKYVAEQGEEEGWRVFSTVVTVMGVAVVALVLLAEALAPQLAGLLGPGFHGEERAQLVFLTRLMLPAQICFYMGSLLAAVQYAKGSFLIPSLAPIVYNVGIILGGVLFSPRYGITGFSIGVLAGAAAGNLLLQIYGARRAGGRFRPNFNLSHPGFRLFLKLSIPIMLALSVTFTDDWIQRWFGSYLAAASITWLSYAKNLMRVPLGVIGQALGVAAFPFLAQLYSEGKLGDLNRTLNSTVKALTVLLLPVSALSMALARPLVYFVFSHTRLTGPDLEATAATLEFFSIGMLAWSVQNMLARGFYASRNTWVPAVVGTLATFAALPVYALLARRMAHLGLALASSIGIIVYAAALFFLLNRRLKNPDAARMVVFFVKVTAASVVAGLGAWAVAGWLEGRLRWQATLGAFEVLIVATLAGALLTVLAMKAVRVRELDDWLVKFRRTLSAAPRV